MNKILIALDDALVAPEDRVEIGKCNMRIDPNKPHKEATYQVVLDTLSLSPCYKAFTITADVPEIYMHQFWLTISKVKDSSSYKLKLDNKTCKIGVEVFRKVLQICPRLPNQEFVAPPSHDEMVIFIKALGYKGALESIPDLVTDHMYQPWRTFATIINRCFSGKTTDPDVALKLGKSISRTEAEEQEAARRVHKTHKRLVTEKPTGRRRQTSVVLRDTPTVSKKKTPAQSLKLKGMEMLSDAAMLEVDTRKAMKSNKHDYSS
ncbi:hypothetical protein Tco_1163172 [Tanacetum coccineum]